MNYFSKIKPVLNKLSELNVYDSLEVVRAYMQASADGNTNRAYVAGVNHSEANSVEVWFADFLIANIIKYCGDFPSQKSLRDVNPRHAICNKIEELHQEISHKQIDEEVFVWLNSYIFNQFKILAKDNELRALYRYYYLYKTPKIKAYAEDKMGMPLDAYFKMAFFVYAIFAGNGRFHVKEDYFTPKRKSFDEVTKTALDYLLSQISKPLPELKRLCKDYCSYDEDKLFGFFNDAPHVKYPLIKDKGGYFCTIPKYITTALLDGLYYRLDIPNSGDPDVNKEFSENTENYLGLIFEHFLNGSKVKCRQEITYDAGKRKTQRTSDWILWDDTDICFMDCKTKRISVKGKQAVTVDDEESLSNTPGYKDRIIKVAQSYREFKNGHPEPIDEKTVKMLSVKNIEECACVIAKEGIGYYLEHHMDNQLMAQKFVKDKFLLDKCNEELINPFLEEMKEYYGK